MTTRTILISTLDDSLPEPDETFQVNLSDAIGATIADGQGIGTILDDGDVNQPPTGNDDAATTAEDTAIIIDVLANDSDPEGDPLTIDAVTQGAHGSVLIDGNQVRYQPDADFHGSDMFSYTLKDAAGNTATADVAVTITPVNDAPVADDQSVAVKENTVKVITLSASDVEGDSLTYSIPTPPSSGTLSGTAPDLNYTPDPDFTGTDSFTFVANDGSADSNVATIVLTVADNLAPEANPQSVSLDEDSSLAITLSGSDPDGDPIAYAVVEPPAHGVLTGTAPNLTYTPDANFHGSDSFTFKVNDGTDESALAVVSITVDPVNDPPTADSQSLSTNEDTSLGITLSGSDVDGDALNYIIVSGPSHGSLSGSGANRTYSPNSNFNGSDSFTFKVSDGTTDSEPAIVNITVEPVNDAPVAVADSYSVDQDVELTVAASGVLANDTDVDGDTLTAVAWSGTSNQGGQVVLNSDGSFTYTPPAGFTGTDTFSYSASDGSLTSDLATVAIEVQANNEDAMYVYDIRFEDRKRGRDQRAVFEIRWDSNGNGQGDSADERLPGVSITVEFDGRTYSGTTDSNGIFRTGWRRNPGSGTYAEVVDLALADYAWDPLALDLEDDTDGDGLPDAQL